MTTQAARFDGRIRPGQRLSIATEFKVGEHWRKPQVFRDATWLRVEYVDKGRSAAEIAAPFGVQEASIFYWLRKHAIPRRSIAEARLLKHWGSFGSANPRFGKRGADCWQSKGGVTAERQAFHGSLEWKAASLAVWRRDNATCQKCGTKQPLKAPAFDVHHIVSFERVELRAVVGNLVLLCRKCHRWVHSKANVEMLFIGSALEMDLRSQV